MKQLVILAFSLLLSISCYCQEESVSKADLFKYKWLNKKLPIDTLVSYNGDTIVLFNTAKKYVISFWYTYCVPCVAEIEWLNMLKEDYSERNIDFIAISFDSNEDVNSLLKSHPFNFELCYLDKKVISENSLAIGYPTNLLVDENGIVLFQKSGGHSDKDKAKEIYDLLEYEIIKSEQ